MKRYALVNYDTGEVYTIEGDGITCRSLYKRALSIRRENIRYNYRQDKMHLFRLDEGKSLTNGALLQEWEGGYNTPIEELGLSVRVYWSLKNRRCDNVGQILEYAASNDIFRRLPTKGITELIKVLRAYDKPKAVALTRKMNERRFKFSLSK